MTPLLPFAPIAPNQLPWTVHDARGVPLGAWDFVPGDRLRCGVALLTTPHGVSASVHLLADTTLRLGARLVLVRRGAVLTPTHPVRGYAGPPRLYHSPECFATVVRGEGERRELVATYAGRASLARPFAMAASEPGPEDGPTLATFLGPWAALMNARPADAA